MTIRDLRLPAGLAVGLTVLFTLASGGICAAAYQVKAQKSPGAACITPTEAAQQTNKDVCVSAHVYDVVELPDGTRFLDICPPGQPDAECRFTILSLPADREDVGDLGRYREQEVRVRGIVRSTHGRMGIFVSHVRQFSGGPEKFKPNPRLLHGFNGQSDRAPIHDPNLAPSGRHRGFMNSADKEPLSTAKK